MKSVHLTSDVWEPEQVWPQEERARKRKLRELKRENAMKGYAKGHERVFQSLEEEPFEGW